MHQKRPGGRRGWRRVVEHGKLPTRLTNPTTMPDNRSLLSRLIRRGVFGQIILAALLFGPAGSLKFWQGWAYIAVSLITAVIFYAYFYKNDPQLLERRLLTREKVKAQKFIMLLMKQFYILAFMLPGLDYRFGWTNKFTGPAPLWLVLFALLLFEGGFLLIFGVIKANRFAAAIIQVEAAQTVITTGPYRFVRHPMYSGFLLLWLATPLALGSFVALPAFVLLIPILIFRLLNEEKYLRRELPGYVEYCQRTRYRLIPFVW